MLKPINIRNYFKNIFFQFYNRKFNLSKTKLNKKIEFWMSLYCCIYKMWHRRWICVICIICLSNFMYAMPFGFVHTVWYKKYAVNCLASRKKKHLFYFTFCSIRFLFYFILYISFFFIRKRSLNTKVQQLHLQTHTSHQQFIFIDRTIDVTKAIFMYLIRFLIDFFAFLNITRPNTRWTISHGVCVSVK